MFRECMLTCVHVYAVQRPSSNNYTLGIKDRLFDLKDLKDDVVHHRNVEINNNASSCNSDLQLCMRKFYVNMHKIILCCNMFRCTDCVN